MHPSLRATLIGGAPLPSMLADAGLTLLRVATGLMMAFGHGIGKVPPQDGFVGMVEGLGFPAPLLFAWLAGLAEFCGGLLLAAGLLTRASALAILGTLFVAAFVAHGGDPLFAPPGQASKEMAVLFALIAAAFVTTGAGRFSIDGILRRRRTD